MASQNGMVGGSQDVEAFISDEPLSLKRACVFFTGVLPSGFTRLFKKVIVQQISPKH